MRLLFLLICLLSSLFTWSQQDTDSISNKPNVMDTGQVVNWKFEYKNNAHVEVLGAGGIYSLNYERVFINKNRIKTLGSVGFAYFSVNPWEGVIFPISINQLLSFDQHHIEVGIGGSPSFVASSRYREKWDVFYFSTLAYRFQRPKGHFMFRAAAMPVLLPEFGVWGGLSFGYCF